MSIHADAVKESKRGSFGYSDIFLYKFMFRYMIPYKKELAIILIYMFLFAISTAAGPILLMVVIDRFAEYSTDNSVFGISVIDDGINSYHNCWTNDISLELTGMSIEIRYKGNVSGVNGRVYCYSADDGDDGAFSRKGISEWAGGGGDVGGSQA